MPCDIFKLQKHCSSKTVAISEVGLLGELRSSAFYEKRVKEAQKLGFKKIFSNKTHKTLVDIISTLGGQNTAS